jgi:ABC-type nitrate/sulfonate/bicarbonate transport system permease component
VALIVCWDLYVRVHGFNVIVLPDPLTVARALLTDCPHTWKMTAASPA